ncbi:hypothetical protein DOY81_000261, partial [Sarcophaga bullata]
AVFRRSFSSKRDSEQERVGERERDFDIKVGICVGNLPLTPP